MKPNNTALENLCEMVCASASAKFIGLRDRRVYFAPDIPGPLPIESLPIADFNSRNVRAVLRQYGIEKVEAQ
jgi:hypothetical protein